MHYVIAEMPQLRNRQSMLSPVPPRHRYRLAFLGASQTQVEAMSHTGRLRTTVDHVIMMCVYTFLCVCLRLLNCYGYCLALFILTIS